MKKLIPVLSLLLLLSSCANGAGSFSSASSSLAPDILEAHRKVPVFNFYTNGQVIPDRDDDNYEEYLSSKATYQDPLSYFIDENFGNALYKIKHYGKEKTIEFFKDRFY